MRWLAGCLLLFVVGCVGQPVSIIENMRFLREQQVNPLSPSLSLTVVQECVKQHGYHETTRINDKVYHCDGQYQTVAIPYAGQNGYIDIGGAVQAGVIGGLGYFAVTKAAEDIGDGIAQSGSQTTVTQQGGGASQSQGQVQGQQSISKSFSKSSARASSSSRSFVVNNPPMGRMD